MFEVLRVVEDEAAEGRHQDVPHYRLHDVLERMVAKRFQQSRVSNAFLVVEVFEGEMAEQDDQLTTQVFHLNAFLEVGLGCFQQKEQCLKEDWGAF